VKVNLGCGVTNLREGYVTIDENPEVNADICARVPPIPLEDESAELIYARHFLEHLSDKDVALLMAEAWRVLKVGAVLEIVVPYVLSHGAWQDPTHKSFWCFEKFLYFSPHMTHLGYGFENRFIFRDLQQNSEEVKAELVKTAKLEKCNCFDCKKGLV
jgi:ubiquinone/menaquinone biosynthesis C-methylase UbiE